MLAFWFWRKMSSPTFLLLAPRNPGPTTKSAHCFVDGLGTGGSGVGVMFSWMKRFRWSSPFGNDGGFGAGPSGLGKQFFPCGWITASSKVSIPFGTLPVPWLYARNEATSKNGVH